LCRNNKDLWWVGLEDKVACSLVVFCELANKYEGTEWPRYVKEVRIVKDEHSFSCPLTEKSSELEEESIFCPYCAKRRWASRRQKPLGPNCY
jgi:hypothetical protein